MVVDDERGDTRHPPGAARVDAGEAVLALKLGDRFRRRHGSVRRERAHRQRELLRPLRLPGEVRLAHRRPDERVVARGDEVQRLPRRRRPDDRGLPEQSLERPAPEPRRARPDTDVRSLRRLRLHPDEALDHRRRRESRALEEELPRKCRAVQLSQREDSFGHRSRHSNPPTERRIRSRGSFVVPGGLPPMLSGDIRERWPTSATESSEAPWVPGGEANQAGAAWWPPRGEGGGAAPAPRAEDQGTGARPAGGRRFGGPPLSGRPIPPSRASLRQPHAVRAQQGRNRSSHLPRCN